MVVSNFEKFMYNLVIGPFFVYGFIMMLFWSISWIMIGPIWAAIDLAEAVGMGIIPALMLTVVPGVLVILAVVNFDRYEDWLEEFDLYNRINYSLEINKMLAYTIIETLAICAAIMIWDAARRGVPLL